MRISDFDYDLPEARIAQHPVEPRDAARLLVDRGDTIPPEHRHVRDLADLLNGSNRSTGNSLVVPSEYLEIVITRH